MNTKDLKAVAWFNRIILNYKKMMKLNAEGKFIIVKESENAPLSKLYEDLCWAKEDARSMEGHFKEEYGVYKLIKP